MSKKARDPAEGMGRILDAWVPPASAGDPVGCIATSFTFHPEHFEDECLSRFLRVESDRNEDGPLYLLDFEEKASQITCAAALVDQHHCRAQRSLRWDLLPVRLPGRAIQHSKISLLYWTNCVRVIIASANLTEDGYRRNQEVFGVVDFFSDSDAPREVLQETLRFLDDILNYTEMGSSPAITRCRDLLRRVREHSASWGTDKPISKDKIRLAAVFTGPNRQNLFDQVEAVWPSQHPRRKAWAVSPFFDPPEAPSRAVAGLWSLLARGNTEVRYVVDADDLPDGRLRVHCPRSLLAVPHDRPRASVSLERIAHQENQDPRPVHFKGLWVESEAWAGYLIGSSNFTSAGTGYGHPNLEANLLYLAHIEFCPAGYKALEAAFPKYEPIQLETVTGWKVLLNDDAIDESGPVGLPAFFRAAVLERTTDGHRVRFTFGTCPPKGWRVVPDEQSASAAPCMDEPRWQSEGEPEELIISWAESRPPYGFTVFWDDCQSGAWWPLNIADCSVLPPPDILRGLPLEVLLEILTSARPLRETLRPWLKQADGTLENTPLAPELDPHRRVDTSAFLLQRARRVSWALQGLREKLCRPVATKESLAWRLEGPVGVQALADALVKEARSEDEKTFLQMEIALALVRIKPMPAPGYLTAETVRSSLRRLATRIATDVSVPENLPKNLREYVLSARQEVLT